MIPDGCPEDLLPWIEDGECDDEANTAQCNYDGGDCCNVNAAAHTCDDCVCISCPPGIECKQGIYGLAGH